MSDTPTAESLYTNLTIETQPESSLMLTGEIPWSVVERYRGAAIEKIGRSIELPGFRKGHIPAEVLVKQVGDMTVLQEVAEIVLARAYPDIVIDKKLDVIGRPEVAVTKLTSGEPIGFRITTAVMPEITLPDYADIAAEVRKKNAKEEVTVTDKELEEFLVTMRKAMADDNDPHETEEAHDHTTKEDEVTPLPELTDAMAQAMGPFETVDALKSASRKHLEQEKETAQKEKNRIAIADAILAKTKADLPHLFIDSELDTMVREFQASIERMGMTFADYLTRQKTSEEKIRKEWEPDAKKRALLQLVLSTIAEREHMTGEPQRVEREVQNILEHMPQANKDSVRAYVENRLANEAVFSWLETGEKEGEKKEDDAPTTETGAEETV